MSRFRWMVLPVAFFVVSSCKTIDERDFSAIQNMSCQDIHEIIRSTDTRMNEAIESRDTSAANAILGSVVPLYVHVNQFASHSNEKLALEQKKALYEVYDRKGCAAKIYQINKSAAPSHANITREDGRWDFRAAQGFSPDLYAVIIGNEQYRAGFGDLPFALNDARAFRKFAVDGLGIPAERIVYLENATAAQMQAAFKKELPLRLEGDVRNAGVIVYFSGHGVPYDGEALLMPSDSDIKAAELYGLPRDAIAEQLRSIGFGKGLVVLDACFTGHNKSGKPLMASKGLSVVPEAKALSGFSVISAARQDQPAWMDDQLGHSLLTYYLLSGFKGAADLDKDNAISAAELEDFVSVSVKRHALKVHGQPQVPEIRGSLVTLLRYQ